MSTSAYAPKYIEVSSKTVLDSQSISRGAIYVCSDTGNMYYDSPTSGTRIEMSPSTETYMIPGVATGSYGSSHTVTDSRITADSICYFIPDGGMRDLYNETGITITPTAGTAVIANGNQSTGKYNVYGTLCVIN